MFWLELFWKINRYFKIIFFRLIYGKNILLPFSCAFRFGFNVIIADKSASVKIGNNCFFNNHCSLNALCGIEIGDNTIVGENVKFYDHNHKYNDLGTLIEKQGYSCAPIKVGHNCWIASDVVVLKGVTIGDNCVIGAGCIIFKDVPDNTLVYNQQNLVFKHIAK